MKAVEFDFEFENNINNFPTDKKSLFILTIYVYAHVS